MQLAWPEKAIIAAWMFITLILLVLHGTAHPAEYSDPAPVTQIFLDLEGRILFMILLPVWAALRVFDWATGGPDRRRAARIVRMPGW